MDEKMSRRVVLQQSAAFGAFVAFGATACNKPAALTCTDTSALAPADVQIYFSAMPVHFDALQHASKYSDASMCSCAVVASSGSVTRPSAKLSALFTVFG